MKTRKIPSGMSFYIILLAVIIMLSFFMSRMNQPETITLSDLIKEIESGKISEVTVAGYTIEVTAAQDSDQPGQDLQQADLADVDGRPDQRAVRKPAMPERSTISTTANRPISRPG